MKDALGEGGSQDKQWYLNTVSGRPELGLLSPSNQRMGPYKSKEDALKAWQIAKKRNEDWEEETRQWNRWYGDGDHEDGKAHSPSDGDFAKDVGS